MTPSKSGWGAGIRRLGLPIAFGLTVAFAWEVFVRTAGTFATPTIPRILGALVRLPFEPEFWPSLATTLLALLIGAVVSVTIGVPLGVIVGRVRTLERLISSYVAMLLSVPLSAVVPIVIILFGIRLTARVVVVVLFTLPILLSNVITGVSNVPRNLLEMAASYGCRGWHLARRVIIPSATPEIFAGLRLGAGRAVIGMVVAELIIIAAGIGKLIDRYSATYRMEYMYAIIIVILLISALFIHVVGVWERRVLWWREAGTRQRILRGRSHVVGGEGR